MEFFLVLWFIQKPFKVHPKLKILVKASGVPIQITCDFRRKPSAKKTFNLIPAKIPHIIKNECWHISLKHYTVHFVPRKIWKIMKHLPSCYTYLLCFFAYLFPAPYNRKQALNIQESIKYSKYVYQVLVCRFMGAYFQNIAIYVFLDGFSEKSIDVCLICAINCQFVA